MQSEDPDSISPRAQSAALPAVARLRLITLHAPETPQRRRVPRRQIVAQFPIERRLGDRRAAKPGIDGLLRVVLADEWV